MSETVGFKYCKYWAWWLVVWASLSGRLATAKGVGGFMRRFATNARAFIGFGNQSVSDPTAPTNAADNGLPATG